MGKSVYSIVLSDDVVAAIDMLALKLGTNRSSLIDSILAERVKVVTPERRMQDIFESIFALMDERFIRDSGSANTALALRSSIAYKYKPTVRYSVDLLRSPEGERIGSLKISFRTRSQAFMDMLGGFFTLWTGTESKFVKRPARYRAESDRLIRDINFPPGRSSISANELGVLIGEYIKAFDSALKAYFTCAEDPVLASQAVSQTYVSALDKGIDLI